MLNVSACLPTVPRPTNLKSLFLHQHVDHSVPRPTSLKLKSLLLHQHVHQSVHRPANLKYVTLPTLFVLCGIFYNSSFPNALSSLLQYHRHISHFIIANGQTSMFASISSHLCADSLSYIFARNVIIYLLSPIDVLSVLSNHCVTFWRFFINCLLHIFLFVFPISS